MGNKKYLRSHLLVLAFSPGLGDSPLHLVVSLLVHLLHHVHQARAGVLGRVRLGIHGFALGISRHLQDKSQYDKSDE